MAWTAPMTAASNATFTAAEFNAHIRDNLLETEPAKATTNDSYFVTTGANAIAQRSPGSDVINTMQTTTSTSYTNLSSVDLKSRFPQEQRLWCCSRAGMANTVNQQSDVGICSCVRSNNCCGERHMGHSHRWYAAVGQPQRTG